MQTITKRTGPGTQSMLATLRPLAPKRALSLMETLRVAELQANRLLALAGIEETPVPADVIADTERIRVEYDFDMPDHASGASDWDSRSRHWVITINGHQPETRQRFTLLHEYKHILDHGHAGLRETTKRLYYGLPAVEFVADYFAGCVLMPRQLLKQAWGRGVQTVADLALRFDVSERAMDVRLSQIGLSRPAQRCRSGTRVHPPSRTDAPDPRSLSRLDMA